MPGHDDGIRYQQFFDNGIAICGWKGPGSSRFPALIVLATSKSGLFLQLTTVVNLMHWLTTHPSPYWA